MQVKDPKPEIMRLEELAIMVKEGQIKLPKFQRPFVWKSSDMLKLLDSIYNGYPIGSLLIWNSSQRLLSERSILGLDVDLEHSSSFPTNYLLDGQQRLTTLCGALFWNGLENPDRWGIFFDLDQEEFVISKEPNLINLFPLNKLIKTADFIKQCMRFDSCQNRDRYYQVAERLLKAIKDYKIAVVTIGDMTIDEVAPIFERINSTGRKLTMVDLMMAATWSNSFDLNKEIHELRKEAFDEGFIDIPDSIILRVFSAAAGYGISKDDIQKLRGEQAKALCIAAKSAGRSLRIALVFLKKEIGIFDFSYLPYSFQLILLTELFRLLPNPNPSQNREIVKWFWVSSASRYFTSANTGQMKRDLLNIRGFAEGKFPSLVKESKIDATELFFSEFNLRNALSTAFAVLLSSGSPTITLDGRPIDEGYQSTKSGRFYFSLPSLDSQLCKLNVSKIIHPYQSFIENHSKSISSIVFLSHFVPNQIFENNISCISERSKFLARKLQELSDCKVVYSIPSGKKLEVEQDIQEDF